MKAGLVFAAVVALALIGTLAFGAWYVLYEKPPAFCELSGRPIHSNMLTRVRVDGEQLYTCCPRCPLHLATQAHKKIELLEVTDYRTARQLAAREAYYVDGSEIEVCSTPRMKLDESRTAYLRLFDRCGPSLLAFADKDEALEFITQYGGTLRRLDEVMAQASVETPKEVTLEEAIHD